MTEHQDKCPECGSMDIRFRTRDSKKGDYYGCRTCGYGPILFPLNYRRKFIAPVIDAETANDALKLVRELKHDV
jgi:ssDNA-binding Zn-finger/Zn-ribbon topoisomerase 1